MMKEIMKQWAQNKQGFTIVELLIVIVVIGILAAITVVAFNGIQNNAHNTAVKSDLSAIAKIISLEQLDLGRYPIGSAELSGLGLKASKDSYSIGMESGGAYYNLVYCWANPSNPTRFSLVAESRSGDVFQFVDGEVSQAPYGFTGGSMTICANSGVPLVSGSSRDWFKTANNWLSYVGD